MSTFTGEKFSGSKYQRPGSRAEVVPEASPKTKDQILSDADAAIQRRASWRASCVVAQGDSQESGRFDGVGFLQVVMGLAITLEGPQIAEFLFPAGDGGGYGPISALAGEVATMAHAMAYAIGGVLVITGVVRLFIVFGGRRLLASQVKREPAKIPPSPKVGFKTRTTTQAPARRTRTVIPTQSQLWLQAHQSPASVTSDSNDDVLPAIALVAAVESSGGYTAPDPDPPPAFSGFGGGDSGGGGASSNWDAPGGSGSPSSACDVSASYDSGSSSYDSGSSGSSDSGSSSCGSDS